MLSSNKTDNKDKKTDNKDTGAKAVKDDMIPDIEPKEKRPCLFLHFKNSYFTFFNHALTRNFK